MTTQNLVRRADDPNAPFWQVLKMGSDAFFATGRPPSVAACDQHYVFNLAQRITAPWFSPSVTVNYAGDPAVEDRVVTEVASYGKQLGWLTEIAIALAKRQPLPEETLRRLEKPPRTLTQSKSKSALPPLRRRTTHSIASNATTQLNMISCCANGGATNSLKLRLRRGRLE